MTRTCVDCGDPSGTFVRCRACRDARLDFARAATGATLATPPSVDRGDGERRQAASPLDVACTWQRGQSPRYGAWVCGAKEGEDCTLPDFLSFDDTRAWVARDFEGRVSGNVTVHERRYRDWRASR